LYIEAREDSKERIVLREHRERSKENRLTPLQVAFICTNQSPGGGVL